jgi:S-DNA-T family DNA segregation ATPase FtsK/SpoIIIE
MSNATSSNDIFNRPPRIYRTWRTETVELPEPPNRQRENDDGNWVMIGMPLVSAIVMLLAYAAISQGRGGGIGLLFGIPMAIMAVMGVIGTVVTNRVRKRRAEEEFKARQDFFEAQLQERHVQLQELYDEEGYLRGEAHPHLEELLKIAGALGAGMLPQPRLWERRISDPDFLSLSVGRGRVPFSTMIKVPEPKPEGVVDPRLFEMEKRYRMLDVAPIIVPLREVGSLGIAGPRAEALALVRSLIWQVAVFQAPSDLRMAFITPKDSSQEWDWAPWLPHAIPLSNDADFSARMYARDDDAVKQLMSTLLDQLSRRRDMQAQQKDKGPNAPPPFTPILVIVDGVERVRDQPALSEIMRDGARYHIYAIFALRHWEEVPSECGAMLDLRQGTPRWVRAGSQWSTEPFKVETTEATVRQSNRLARTLAPLRLIESGSNQDVPRNVRLFDLLNIRDEHDLKPPVFWQQTPHPDRGWHPDVPIGQKGGNQPLCLDLYQHMHGSHGIIAGATGAGKSVLMQSVIAALAIKHSPMQMQILLIDFKGGASLEMLSGLPHTVGFVTDLEGRLAERAMIAIKSELRYRKTMLRTAAAKIGSKVEDLKDFRNTAKQHNLPALANLLIVIDEYDEMVQSYKEFVAELVRVVKQGRSLGVHLLVATQQPSKAVTDDIRTQLKYFIALRLGSSEDSREMLDKRPDAAFLPTDLPGRAYFRVGPDATLFQAAQVTSAYRLASSEKEAAAADIDDIQLHGFEPTPRMRKAGSAPGERRETDLDVLIRTLREAGSDFLKHEFQRSGWQPRPIWQPPLPASLPLSKLSSINAANLSQQLQCAWGGQQQVDWLSVTLGNLDIPQESRQEQLTLSLNDMHLAVFGVSGSGKTMLLRTLLLSLALTHSPRDVWCYAIDAGGQGLGVFAQLPHVGGVIQTRDRERVFRLLSLIEREIIHRQELFRVAGAGDLPTYRREQDQSLPAWIIVIDKIALLREEFKDRNGFETITDDLIRLIRIGRLYGVHFIITADGIRDMSHHLLALLDGRIALRMQDTNDYNEVLGARVTSQIPATLPGRGLYVRAEQGLLDLQVALPLLDPPTRVTTENGQAGSTTADEDQATLLDSELNAELKETIAGICAVWQREPDAASIRPMPVELLPERVLLRDVIEADGIPTLDFDDTIVVPCALESLHLGIAALQFGRVTPYNVIFGGRRSGKTTALQTMLTALTQRYSPDEMRFIIIDSARRGLRAFSELPHTALYAVAESEMQNATDELQRLLDQSGAPDLYRWMVVVDDFDIGYKNMESQFRSSWDKPNLFGALKRVVNEGGERGIYLTVAANISYPEEAGDIIKTLNAGRNGLILWPHKYDNGTRLLDIRLPIGERDGEQPRGRALLVQEDLSVLVQVALASEADVMSVAAVAR